MSVLEITVQGNNAADLLGVLPDADRKEIRSAFCKLAFSCHPDLHQGDPKLEHRFKLLSEAYQAMVEKSETGMNRNFRSKISKNPARGKDLRFRLHLDPAFAAEGGKVSFRFLRKKSYLQDSAAEPIILRVDVPPGMKDGDQIRLSGQGEPGESGESAGDLYITVSIKE